MGRHRKTGDRRDRAAWLAQAAAGVMMGSLVGCQTFGHKGQCSDCIPPKSPSCHYHALSDKLVTKETAWRCANKELHRLKKECGGFSRHFEYGFHKAYEDLALGRYAVPPPVPPSKYWTAYYRSCAGEEAVDDWYAGYRMGLDIGLQSGVSGFNRVASSADVSRDEW